MIVFSVSKEYCSQAVEICLRYTELHAQFAPEIQAAMEASVARGTPVNPPIWWVDPLDEVALAVDDGELINTSFQIY